MRGVGACDSACWGLNPASGEPQPSAGDARALHASRADAAAGGRSRAPRSRHLADAPAAGGEAARPLDAGVPWSSSRLCAAHAAPDVRARLAGLGTGLAGPPARAREVCARVPSHWDPSSSAALGAWPRLRGLVLRMPFPMPPRMPTNNSLLPRTLGGPSPNSS